VDGEESVEEIGGAAVIENWNAKDIEARAVGDCHRRIRLKRSQPPSKENDNFCYSKNMLWKTMYS
jgi:hypothetical protein